MICLLQAKVELQDANLKVMNTIAGMCSSAGGGWHQLKEAQDELQRQHGAAWAASGAKRRASGVPASRLLATWLREISNRCIHHPAAVTNSHGFVTCMYMTWCGNKTLATHSDRTC